MRSRSLPTGTKRVAAVATSKEQCFLEKNEKELID